MAAVQVVLSHHPNSEQDAQVQQVELVAGSQRTLLLTESTRVTSTGAKMVSIFGNGANRVLELDWANGLVCPSPGSILPPQAPSQAPRFPCHARLPPGGVQD